MQLYLEHRVLGPKRRRQTEPHEQPFLCVCGGFSIANSYRNVMLNGPVGTQKLLCSGPWSYKE